MQGTASIADPVSLYIHLPWCLHKCDYCDFNSHATAANDFPEQAYVDALLADLNESVHTIQGRQVASIFIGGGTPSLFSPASIDTLLQRCRELMPLTQDCEITLETNPGTFERNKFAEFLAVGVNRLSIGVQSLNDQHLKALGRIHNRDESILAIETAANIGFTNINADLMFGLPNQSCADAQTDISSLCELPLTHISYYQLTLEPNTVFYRFPPRLPDEDTLWTMQHAAIEQLQAQGYTRYEVSAYARSQRECVHNTNYWRYGDYLGVGAGAHSKITAAAGISRQQRPRQPDSYMQAVAHRTQVIHDQLVDTPSLIFEFMLNNLRLSRGFSTAAFTRYTGLDWQCVEAMVQTQIDEQLMACSQDRYHASDLGFRFLDDLTQRFLPSS